jgi:hypothetical protein
MRLRGDHAQAGDDSGDRRDPRGSAWLHRGGLAQPGYVAGGHLAADVASGFCALSGFSLHALDRHPSVPLHSGVGAVTTGLSSQVGREIEFEGDRLGLSDVIDKVSGLAAYLIEHGMAINDGDSVGASETERLKATYATSKRFSGWPVLLVTSAAGSGGGSR